MSDDPENLVLRLLREMRADMATKADIAEMAKEYDLANMVTKDDLAKMASKDDLRLEINALRADVASDLITTRKEFSEQIVGLRRAVVEYHTSVIGHGIPISDLEARVRRIEQRLDLQPEPH